MERDAFNQTTNTNDSPLHRLHALTNQNSDLTFSLLSLHFWPHPCWSLRNTLGPNREPSSHRSPRALKCPVLARARLSHISLRPFRHSTGRQRDMDLETSCMCGHNMAHPPQGLYRRIPSRNPRSGSANEYKQSVLPMDVKHTVHPNKFDSGYFHP